jgi:surface antigen
LMVATLISLSACGSATKPYYGHMSTASNFEQNKSLFNLAFNIGKANAYTIPTKDRDRHERCVYFALETLPAGESCNWYSTDNSASGEVKVVQIYPAGSGSCQVFHTSLNYKGQTKNIQDTACWYPNVGKWQFVSK